MTFGLADGILSFAYGNIEHLLGKLSAIREYVCPCRLKLSHLLPRLILVFATMLTSVWSEHDGTNSSANWTALSEVDCCKQALHQLSQNLTLL
jgi:hypothetical protein